MPKKNHKKSKGKTPSAQQGMAAGVTTPVLFNHNSEETKGLTSTNPVMNEILSMVSPYMPLLGDLYNVLQDPLMESMHYVQSKKENTARTFLQAMYKMQASFQLPQNTENCINDQALHNFYLDRLITATNLELVWFINLKKIMDKTMGVILQEFSKSMFSMVNQIITGFQKDSKANPFMMMSNFFNDYHHLWDYLPLEKIRMLLVQPSSLWSAQRYGAYKAGTSLDVLSQKIQALIPNAEPQTIEFLVDQFRLLREELITIYDLLAEKDKEMKAYWQEKKYNPQALFLTNKTCLLEAFSQLTDYLEDAEKDREIESIIADELRKNILDKEALVKKQNNWINIDSNANYRAFYGSMVNASDSLKLMQQAPTVHTEIMLIFILKLNSRMAKKWVNKLFDTVSSSLSGITGIFSGFALDSIKKQALAFLKEVDIAQENGREGAYRLLSKYPSFGATKGLQIANILGNLGAFTNGLNPNLNSLWQNVRQHLPTIEVVDEAEEKTKASERAEQKDPPKDFVMLIQAKRVEEAHAQLLSTPEPAALLLIAIQSRAYPIVRSYLATLKKKDTFMAGIRLVPTKVAHQKALLEAVIDDFQEEQMRAQAEEILVTMLNPRYEWSDKAIAFCENKPNLHPNALTILKSYSLFGATVSETTNIAGTAETGADKVRMHYGVSPGIDASSSSSSSSYSGSVNSTSRASSSVCSFFTKLSLDTTLSAFSLSKKLQDFSNKLSPELQNIQAYALCFLSLRFFQAYQIDSQQNIQALPIDIARKIRNAFVHQHNQNDTNGGSVGFVLDGQYDALLTFSGTLANSIRASNATAMMIDPLFNKLVIQGDTLFQQQNAGTSESIKIRQRIVYTGWLTNTLQSFQRLQGNLHFQEHSEMIHYAIAMLQILRKVYCLREGACPQKELDKQIAMSIRHAQALLNFETPNTGFVAENSMI